MGTKLWEPPEDLVENALMTRYMRWLDKDLETYDDLWRFSVEDLEGFWASIWEFFEVGSSYDEVLAKREMPGAVWFKGAEVNYAERAFQDKDDDALAIVHASEARDQAEMTWGELRSQVARIAAGLRALGVERGDRVAAYMPNIPEAIAAFLATASLGAVWSSCSPDFGARSVVDRFAQIEPKVLLAVDGYRYNGKDYDRSETVAGIHDEVGGELVRLGYLDGSGWQDGFLGEGELYSSACRSTTRCGSSTRRAPPACPRRSSRARAGSSSSTSRCSTCTSTRSPGTASSGTRRPAG